MQSRFIAYFLIIACITSLTLVTGALAGIFHKAAPVVLPPRKYDQTVVLLPLDSRPACTQLVEQLASLANIRIMLPPAEYLDNYTQPGNRQALAKWLRLAAREADALIVSTDMLISGGLLSSRVNIPSQADLAAAAELLTEIKRNNPPLRIYSFHIIPRLLIADHTPYKQYQKPMQKYSILQEQISLFDNPLDHKAALKLEKTIPKQVIDRYKELYQRNEQAHRLWINLVKNNILESLVIGQDDGYHFGMPNMLKQRLNAILDHEGLNDRVIVTRGTDEVALTLLGRLALDQKSPRVFVEYSSAAAPQVVMPFMPHSVFTTVREKLKLLKAEQVNTPTDADFVLFVHIGRINSSYSSLKSAALRLKDHINQGRKVALVDLTEDYYAWETLLPYIVDANIPLNRLIAYAGWNTTSNSIGTAVTQAALYTANSESDKTARLRLYYDNLTFLTARLLDDWHYLKEIQPEINKRLAAFGTNPYRLKNMHSKTESLIRRELTVRSQRLLRESLSSAITIPGYNQPFLIDNISNTIIIPWDRTFEIRLDPHISLIQLQ